jgi:phosphoglycolate phosphatase
MYKHILWDWNGTLLNDAEICVSVMNQLLSKRDMPLSDMDFYRKVFGFPVINYYKELGFDFSKEPFEKVSVEFITEYQKQSYSAELVKDAENVLSFCRSKGYSQSVLSASQIENLTSQVNHFGIGHYFDKLLGLDHVHATSKVEIGKAWLSFSGLDRANLLMVGDTVHDFETARELGSDVILLSSGHQSRERLSGLGVTVIDDIIEIKNYLQ